jgi:hypothetical protein
MHLILLSDVMTGKLASNLSIFGVFLVKFFWYIQVLGSLLSVALRKFMSGKSTALQKAP